jgi:hypothetical protein
MSGEEEEKKKHLNEECWCGGMLVERAGLFAFYSLKKSFP